jgi:hypothetical protein
MTDLPGDALFAELSENVQLAILPGWGLDPTDAGDMRAAERLFNQLSPGNRWHVLCTLQGRNDNYVAEVERVAAKHDPYTDQAFDQLCAEIDENERDADYEYEFLPGELAMNGDALLSELERFLFRFVAYPTEAARVAHVLWVAHTHRMDAWDSTPRIAFLSPERGSGKTRALEVTELLVPRPLHAVNVTAAYLFRKVSDPAGAPTILYDEADTVFGPKVRSEHEDIRAMFNAGHRRGATAGRCVVKGVTVMTEDLPAYCAVALAGLDDLPDTIISRSVVIHMRRRAPNEYVEPFRARECEARGHVLRDALGTWSRAIEAGIWPDLPEQITDRNADVWEALLAVADAAGGRWPKRAREAAVTLVTDVTGAGPSLGERLLADLKAVFNGAEVLLPTTVILERLHELEESPWGDIRGKPLDARGLASRLRRFGIRPMAHRMGERVVKGYSRADFVDPWMRYVDGAPLVSPEESVTSVTPETSSLDQEF